MNARRYCARQQYLEDTFKRFIRPHYGTTSPRSPRTFRHCIRTPDPNTAVSSHDRHLIINNTKRASPTSNHPNQTMPSYRSSGSGSSSNYSGSESQYSRSPSQYSGSQTSSSSRSQRASSRTGYAPTMTSRSRSSTGSRRSSGSSQQSSYSASPPSDSSSTSSSRLGDPLAVIAGLRDRHRDLNARHARDMQAIAEKDEAGARNHEFANRRIEQEFASQREQGLRFVRGVEEQKSRELDKEFDDGLARISEEFAWRREEGARKYEAETAALTAEIAEYKARYDAHLEEGARMPQVDSSDEALARAQENVRRLEQRAMAGERQSLPRSGSAPPAYGSGRLIGPPPSRSSSSSSRRQEGYSRSQSRPGRSQSPHSQWG